MHNVSRPGQSASFRWSPSGHNKASVKHQLGGDGKVRRGFQHGSAKPFSFVLLPLIASFVPMQLGSTGLLNRGHQTSVVQRLVQYDTNGSNMTGPPDQSDQGVGSDNADQPSAQSYDNGDLPQAGPTDDSGAEPQEGVNPDEGNDQSYQSPEDQNENPESQPDDSNPNDEQNQQSTPEM
jgi:hypothetical protein